MLPPHAACSVLTLTRPTSSVLTLPRLTSSVLTLTRLTSSVGGTDFYPSIKSPFETFIVTLLVILGALLWTQVLAMFCDVATNGDPGMTLFRQVSRRSPSSRATPIARPSLFHVHLPGVLEDIPLSSPLRPNSPTLRCDPTDSG